MSEFLSHNGDSADPVSVERRRRDLERRAFGPTGNPAQEADALAARRQLMESDAGISPQTPLDHELTPVNPTGPTPGVPDVLEADLRRERLPYRNSVLLVAAAAGALIVGVLAGHATATRVVATPAPTVAPIFPTAKISIAMPTSGTAIGAAWFSRHQEAADRFSFYDAPRSGYLAASVRLVVSSPTLGDLYIAKRSRGDNGVCLILDAPKSPDGQQGTSSCSTTNSFMKKGITLEIGGRRELTAHWTAETITVSSKALP